MNKKRNHDKKHKKLRVKLKSYQSLFFLVARFVPAASSLSSLPRKFLFSLSDEMNTHWKVKRHVIVVCTHKNRFVLRRESFLR